jgi:hypothetical protein
MNLGLVAPEVGKVQFLMAFAVAYGAVRTLLPSRTTWSLLKFGKNAGRSRWNSTPGKEMLCAGIRTINLVTGEGGVWKTAQFQSIFITSFGLTHHLEK